MVMAFGPTKCGKTTALNCAASITGSKIWGTGTGFSLAAAYQQAHGSTMGYCLDDVKDDKMLEDIVVGTYNQGGQVNMAVGRKTPKCTPVLTSNFVPSDPRVLSRLAIIPFFIPSNPLREPERMNKEMEVMDAMELAGRNIGIVIKVGSIYQQEQERDHIYGNLTEFTMNAIGEEFIREAVNYAEVIGFTDMFCCQIEGPTLDELKVYFTDVVAPFFIKDIAKKGDQSSGSNVISGGLQYTAKDIQDEIAAMCTKDPQKAIHFIYPSTLCNDTKERCVGISVTEFVDAAQKRFPLSSVRDLLKPLICQCKTRHQAPGPFSE